MKNQSYDLVVKFLAGLYIDLEEMFNNIYWKIK